MDTSTSGDTRAVISSVGKSNYGENRTNIVATTAVSSHDRSILNLALYHSACPPLLSAQVHKPAAPSSRFGSHRAMDSLAFAAAAPLASLAPRVRTRRACALRASLEVEAEQSEAKATSVPEAPGAPAWLGSVLRAAGPSPASAQLAAAALKGAGAAEAAAASANMPGRRQEAWRFTDLRALYGVRCGSRGAEAVDSAAVAKAVEALVPEEAGAVLVFLDGEYVPAASTVDGVESLAEVAKAGGYIGALDGYTGELDAMLALLEKREVGVESGGPFAAVSSALARDVCVFDVPAGVAVSKPVAIVCLSSGGADEASASAGAPRLVVRAGAGASVELLETHAVVDGAARPWACVISGSAFDVGVGANVEHYLVNDMPSSAHHLAHVHAEVAKDGTYKNRNLMLGSQVCRVSLGVDLDGEGAHGEAFGIMIADGKRVTDLHSRISHNAPSCTSNQYQKNIASDNGRVVFSGKILVQKIAQETDSQQLCRSMLLSNKARVDAMPVLEISADQVKCTHGATVSDLSQEELFYCLSRGISEAQAQELLIASFALDVLKDCPFELLKTRTTASARKLIPGMQKVSLVDRSELYQSI